MLINKGIDKKEGRIVYVTKTEQNAIKARKLGIKSIIAEEVEGVFAFHTTLIFAVLYARARPIFSAERNSSGISKHITSPFATVTMVF